jgi:hypothetical protein
MSDYGLWEVYCEFCDKCMTVTRGGFFSKSLRESSGFLWNEALKIRKEHAALHKAKGEAK